MIRSLLIFAVACFSLTACAADTVDEEKAGTPPTAERVEWKLASINGAPLDLPEWAAGRQGEILAWSDGDIVQFDAGCGFSISTHNQPVVVRQASPASRPCSAQDIDLLKRLEAIAGDGARVLISGDQMTLSSAGGDTVVFSRDLPMAYPD